MSEGSAGRGDVSRKGFIDWILGTSIGGFVMAVAYPVVKYWIPPEIPESAVSSVILPFGAGDMAPNSGRIFKFGSKPGLLIRDKSGDLKALTARCTHLDCTVQYREDLEHVWCACHNGHYDEQGRVLAGPPPEPLTQYDVNVRGDQIVVSLKA